MIGFTERWDSGKAWEQLHKRLETDGLLEDRPSAGAGKQLHRLLRIAASITGSTGHRDTNTLVWSDPEQQRSIHELMQSRKRV